MSAEVESKVAARASEGGSSFGRVLLKLGEALLGRQTYGIDLARVESLADEIETVQGMGVQTALVLGAGNIYRGMEAAAEGMDRATADYAGMLATVLNCLGGTGRSSSAASTRACSRPSPSARSRSLTSGAGPSVISRRGVVIFAGGTGNPFFTTDTAARSARSRSEPRRSSWARTASTASTTATRTRSRTPSSSRRSPTEALERGLKVMDSTALSLCMDNGLPIYVSASTTSATSSGSSRASASAPSSRLPGGMDDSDRGLRERGEPQDLDRSVESAAHEFNTIRTGRASAALLDRIQIDYYGTPTPLQQLATVNVP